MNYSETTNSANPTRRFPWNKGKLVGPKPPLRLSHVWSIRAKLQIERRVRDLALFNLAIDSELRGCDIVAVRVDDVAPNGYTVDRATIRQRKTGRPVRFELTEQTLRDCVSAMTGVPQIADDLAQRPSSSELGHNRRFGRWGVRVK